VSLPRAMEIAFGKDLFGKNHEYFFVEGLGSWPSAKVFFLKNKKYLPREALGKEFFLKNISLPRAGPQQRNRQRRRRLDGCFSLPSKKFPEESLLRAALGKAFAEGF